MKIFLTTILLLLLFTPIVMHAQDDQGPIFNNPISSLQGKSPQTIVGQAIKVALGLVGIVALILFINAGFIWLTAQGSAEKIKKAQAIMAWAGIGLVVIFSSYALLSLVFGIIK